MRKILLLVLLSAAPIFAQSTTYTGTIKDLTGAAVTSGRITWTLKPPGVSNASGIGSFVSTTVSCLINGTGNPVSSTDGVSPCVITNNTLLSPTGTYYNVCIQPYNNVSPGSCLNTFALGGTVDITTLVPTPATSPAYGAASTQVANTWNLPQAFPGGISGPLAVSGALTALALNGVINANLQVGSDIGAKVNAAFPDCLTPRTVFIPAGIYTQTTTINIPACANAKQQLVFDKGAILNYTGSSWAIIEQPSVSPNDVTNDAIINPTITGTSSGLGGILLEGLSGSVISNATISGFSNGDGIGLYGADAVDISPNRIVQNKNGIHLVAVTIFGGTVTSNADKIIGGVIGSNTNWNIFDDDSGPGHDQNNVITTTFENGGTTSNPSTGNLFIQGASGDVVTGSYLETTMSGAANVVIGDGTHTANQPVVRSNFLYGNGIVAADINNVNSTFAVISDNFDATSFVIQQGANAVATCAANNTSLLASPNIAFASGAPPFACFKNQLLGGWADNLPTQSFSTDAGFISMDGNDALRNAWLFVGTGPTLISRQIISAGSDWKVVLRGTWYATVSGRTTAFPPYLEVTSTAPSIPIGGSTLTFSLNLANQIQAVYGTSGHDIIFVGSIDVYSANQSNAQGNSMQLAGNLVTPGVQTNGNANGSVSMSGTTSGTVTQTVNSAAGTYTFIWPTTNAVPVFLGTLTTTAATTDSFSNGYITSASHCFAQASNSTAVIAGLYFSAYASGSVTVNHTATSGMTFNIWCAAD